MTVVLVTVLSILALTGAAWLAARILPFAVCPVCVGVAGTWLWMVIAQLAGIGFDAWMPAILLGGSVVGAADRLESRLPPGRSPLLWKALFVPTGFATAYGLAASHWGLLAGGSAALAFLAAAFFLPRRGRDQSRAAVEELERRLEKCC